MEYPVKDKRTKDYTKYRNKLYEIFREKYQGLNINGVDYRDYVFNFFEAELSNKSLLGM